jgi:hypothetical protein
MTTNSKNLREYADSARRAYVNSVRDVYLATECSMYLAEYKLALAEAHALARTEALGTDMLKHAKCQDGIYCHGPGCKLRTGKTARKKNEVGVQS